MFPIQIRKVVVSGPTGSGKTMLGLTTGAPMERVLVYDTEGSALPYASVLPFRRVDIAEGLPPTYRLEEYWVAWMRHVASLKPDTYDVIMVDTVELLDEAAVAWVRANPAYFGYSEAQFRSYSYFMWRCVHNTWRSAIVRLSKLCQLLILTAHVKNVYSEQGAKVIGIVRRGKPVFTEMADLEVILSKGSPYPSATVIKSRVLIPQPQLRNLFPSGTTISPFTWDHLREQMQKALGQKS